MPQVMVARVTCPNCNQPFQARVEQILDVDSDPSAKARLLNSAVNIAVCPHCNTGGALNLPFLYHDAEKELALVYMPIEAGRDDMERQQAIGKLTGAVMEQLPAEERKAYLLQPEVFLSMENITNRVLEAEGITPEMVEAQKAKADLLRRLIEASSDEVLEAMIKENDEAIDNDLFDLLMMNLEMAESVGQTEAVQQLLALRDKLLESSSYGQDVKAQTEMLETLRAEPSRDKLLTLLIQAPNRRTRELLVTFGRPLMDYRFFQSLTGKIDAATDDEEQDRLAALRTEILEIRDQLDEMTKALYEERSALLRDLLLSDDPESLARRRLAELDQAFFNVLSANLAQAESEGDTQAREALEAIWQLILNLMDESLPPEIRLTNQLMGTTDEETLDNLLEENRELVSKQLMAILEQAETRLKEAEEEEKPDNHQEVLAHLARVKEKVSRLLAG